MEGGVLTKDKQTMINMAHYQFVASAKVVKLGHQINTDFSFVFAVLYELIFIYIEFIGNGLYVVKFSFSRNFNV